MREAAVVTVGTELVSGLVIDTNAAEIGLALTCAGIRVAERTSVPDDLAALAALLRRLSEAYDLVVVTGGLGPTHDDITREAASQALSLPLRHDDGLAEALRTRAEGQTDPRVRAQVYRQAEVIEGATVLPARIGTAPGQVVPTSRGHLVLLPGPPRELRPMLPEAMASLGLTAIAPPAILGTTGLSESAVQLSAQRALEGSDGVGLTVLARPGEVRAVLFDSGAGPDGVASAADAVAAELGERCFGTAGESLAEAVLREGRAAGATVGTAESCTGGMIAAALTDIPGSSDVFLGGVVSYSNALKTDALGVPAGILAEYGAVSEEVAAAMAEGARELTRADVCVSVTGVAGPGGGTAEKPVGLVWFGMVSPLGLRTTSVRFGGDRAAVRLRATATALDMLRLELLRMRG